MKLWKFGSGLALCLLLAACAPMEPPEDPAQTEVPVTTADPVDLPPTTVDAAPSLAEDEEPTVILCRIVDGAEEGNLLLAELDEGLYGGSGVYRLNLKDVPVTLDGNASEPSALEDGMAVEVAFNGFVAESFPAQLGEVYSLPTIFFNAEKWRSSLGAYIFQNCSAMWSQGGTWTGYQIGSEMIS